MNLMLIWNVGAGWNIAALQPVSTRNIIHINKVGKCTKTETQYLRCERCCVKAMMSGIYRVAPLKSVKKSSQVSSYTLWSQPLKGGTNKEKQSTHFWLIEYASDSLSSKINQMKVIFQTSWDTIYAVLSVFLGYERSLSIDVSLKYFSWS